MQNCTNTPLSYRMPSERLNTSSYAVDTVKSFSEQSEYDQILQDIASLGKSSELLSFVDRE